MSSNDSDTSQILPREPIFSIGDTVYYDKNEIGIITDVEDCTNGKRRYRINYCQDKDLNTGPRGGNGPIWKEGYPKPVTEPSDVLFVAALKERSHIAELKKQLAEAESNFSALKKAREILLQTSLCRQEKRR